MTRIRAFFLQIRALLYDDFLTRVGTPSPSPFSYAPASTACIYLCQQQEDRRCKVSSKLTIKTLEWRYWGNMKTPTWEIATQMIPTRQFPPRKLPPKKIPTQDKSHLDNFHPGKLPLGKFPPGQLPPGKFPPRQLPPGKLSPDNSHIGDSHLENFYLANC